MILYHGTSVDSARRILREGFRYGVKYNWSGDIKSKEGFIYLSLAYAPFYSETAKSTSKMRAIVKVSVPINKLYPDEDFLFHALKLKTQREMRDIDICQYKHAAKHSLQYLGNCAALPEDITVLGAREFDAKRLIYVCDPSISPIAYKVMGDYYKKLTDWIYKGGIPEKFEHEMFRRPK